MHTRIPVPERSRASVAAVQLGQRPPDRAAGKARGTRHRRDPSMPRRQRLGCRKPSPAALVKHGIKRLKPLADGRFVNHTRMIEPADSSGNPPT